MIWRTWIAERNAPYFDKSEIEHSKAFTWRTHVRDYDKQILVRAFNTSGAEEYWMDLGNPAEAPEHIKSARDCLCWDILCCQGLHAATGAWKVYGM